ncbi:hypothetical protein HBI56_181310 [Parastagonospora nodorum]|uniref:BZIP domain-containing protein n=2 Tax=Phaeosphaeria nodorum (strain SN15 / ATCC MYA-4574 / FGSC 10173) TaxID=321614 RepID=A0A7U2FB54_PHANO|nr:hypothetical protein SNOG_15400 [Parastagonospora nodorum SN15]KAH3907722.1 hypothetical protein HBH56_186690 [Parastagonospora nodorum]EAT77333.1 hypothetical protein SNOG_15400 [Parastagonospora nodorum SN15]KAH3925291.1 hypothetical protein HBH54_181860 [Parastagonospora nodorum]KAH3940678.1 hypothetical protein HBH53_213470 [Parastagonospora nodorum]KAH3958236.1 hypothetical protein HBH51_212920 [Parastagonospora nodorum]
MPSTATGKLAPTPPPEPAQLAGSADSGSWKNRLSDRQLKRKRAVDRDAHRESRAKTRQTIAVLQEQLRQMAEGRDDVLVLNLLAQVEELEKQRDMLKMRLGGVLSAVGLTGEERRALEARNANANADANYNTRECLVSHVKISEIEPVVPEPTAAGPIVADELPGHGSSQQPPSDIPDDLHMSSVTLEPLELACTGNRSPVDTELNHRMVKERQQLSLFVQISHATGSADHGLKLCSSDDDFLESIILWKLSNPIYQHVYPLANSLLHIDLAPTCITAVDMDQYIASPTFAQDLDRELFPDYNWTLQHPRPPPSASLDNKNLLQMKKRQVIAAALFCTRHWTYISHRVRLVMFTVVYKLILFLVLPTVENLHKCPRWYRPVAAQFLHPHPSFIDLLPWPLLRERLVHSYPSYENSDLISSILSNLQFSQPRLDTTSPITLIGSDLEFSPVFDQALDDLSNLSMDDAFCTRYPELTACVNTAPADSMLPPASVTTDPASLQTERSATSVRQPTRPKIQNDDRMSRLHPLPNQTVAFTMF